MIFTCTCRYMYSCTHLRYHIAGNVGRELNLAFGPQVTIANVCRFKFGVLVKNWHAYDICKYEILAYFNMAVASVHLQTANFLVKFPSYMYMVSNSRSQLSTCTSPCIQYARFFPTQSHVPPHRALLTITAHFESLYINIPSHFCIDSMYVISVCLVCTGSLEELAYPSFNMLFAPQDLYVTQRIYFIAFVFPIQYFPYIFCHMINNAPGHSPRQ